MRPVLDSILDRIYKDNPAWWPYGLKRSMLDEAFLIRHPQTQEPCGFTGWQFRRDNNGTKTGYYAVGVLPEFRRQGLAKAALQEMFSLHQPADVTARKAFIVPGNKPSMALASSLGVPVQHKAASLHRALLSRSLPKMARLEPQSYRGVAMQQFMPLVARRHNFSPDEQRDIQDGQSQWFPRLFKSLADSPAVDMMSPGRAALMAGLGGGSLVGLGLHAAGVSPKGVAGGALGSGALAALAAHFATRAHNNTVEETMRRIPEGGTRRDVLSDPVLQAEMNRDSRDGTSEEGLRTAQLLAVLQAAKQAAVKCAGWGDVARSLKGFFTHPGFAVPATSALGAAGYDATQRAMAHQPFLSTDQLHDRLVQGLYNTAVLSAAGGLARGAVPSGSTAGARNLATGGAMLGAATVGMPAKDFLMGNRYAPQQLVEAIRDSKAPAAQPSVAPPAGSSSFNDAVKFVGEHPWLTGGVALGGLGLLGAGGIAAGGAIKDLRESLSRDQGGRIRVTLPTRRQGDAETSLDLPVRDMPLSDALLGRLQRDTRSRLHAETKERTRHVNLSPEERARRAAILLQNRRA